MCFKKWIMAGVILGGIWWGTKDQGNEARSALGNNNPADNAVLVKRGAYLVNEVARCGDCHTPRNPRGGLDLTRHLQGAPLWFTPKIKPREWEGRAPDITLSGKAGKWNEARMIKYLMSGESDPPMPSYRLTLEDARAITAYLRSSPSLPGGKNNRPRGRRRENDDD